MPPTEFNEAVTQARKGEKVFTTPRELVGWWGVSRRGRNIVTDIRKQMKKNKVMTFPDFEAAYIDDPIVIISSDLSKEPKPSTKTVESVDRPASVVAVEPAHRISRLKAANREPLSVKPGDDLNRAVTLMLQNEYSQLPVMSTPSQVTGMVSWRSIGRKLHVAGPCAKVADCTERAYEVPDTASLFDVIQQVAIHDAVLVRSDNNKICGIVTNADISGQFRTLAEPFLLLGDIESVLRRLIDNRFNKSELKAAVDPGDTDRKVESANNLSFGEYLRLIEKPGNWDRLKLALDRAEVVKKLERIRMIRNEVMHFDPDPLDPESIELLRSFAKFLSGLLDLLD